MNIDKADTRGQVPDSTHKLPRTLRFLEAESRMGQPVTAEEGDNICSKSDVLNVTKT